MMRKLVVSAAIVLGLVSGGYAVERGVTPYGDFCPKCTNYGMCRTELSQKKALSAIKAYFHNKGFSIGKVRGRGRFIKVDIYRGESLVDQVIFDKKTGRLRSIY